MSTFQVVLVPTVVGVLTNEFFPGLVRRLKPVLPLIGVALTTLLCASPCAQVATILRWAAVLPGIAGSALSRHAPPFPMAELALQTLGKLGIFVCINHGTINSGCMLHSWWYVVTPMSWRESGLCVQGARR